MVFDELYTGTMPPVVIVGGEDGITAQLWPVYEKAALAAEEESPKFAFELEEDTAAGNGSAAGNVPLTSRLPGKESNETVPESDSSGGGGL